MKEKHPLPPEFEAYLQGRLDKNALQEFENRIANDPNWSPYLKDWQKQRQLLQELRHRQIELFFDELDQRPDSPHIPPL
jgi:anti-sigma factor RsiW